MVNCPSRGPSGEMIEAIEMSRRFQTVQRMVGDVEAQHVALEGELGALVPVLLGDDAFDAQMGGLVASPAHPEQVVLAVGLVALEVDDGVDGLLEDIHEPAPGMAHRVERPGLDERLDGPLVAHLQGHVVEELEEVVGRAVLVAGLDHLVDQVLVDVADRPQAEADVGPDGGEGQRGCVDVGRQHVDVLGPHVRQV